MHLLQLEFGDSREISNVRCSDIYVKQNRWRNVCWFKYDFV